MYLYCFKICSKGTHASNIISFGPFILQVNNYIVRSYRGAIEYIVLFPTLPGVTPYYHIILEGLHCS